MLFAYFAGLIHAGSVYASLRRHQFRRQDGPIPSGTISDCTYFVNATTGDTCASIAVAWGITTAQFITYNPSVKSDCSGLIIGDSYCVEENYGLGPTSTHTSTPLPSTSIITITTSGPSPEQSGIASNCKAYYKVQSGDSCSGIVNKYHTFTLQDFYSWNPAVGDSCQSLLAGYYVCVGVPGTPTGPPPTSATPTGPLPEQSGIASNCNSFYKVISGDTCLGIVDKYGTFTLADFYIWNPAVSSTCSALEVGYYVCVGVPGTPTGKSTSTLATPTGPSPTQTGIISTCTKYYQAKSGDSCSSISESFGTFTVTQFEAWNPAVGNSCATLFVGYYYCVAIPGTPTTRSATPNPTSSGPQPEQSGIVSSCNKYYLAKSGDSCSTIEKSQGITATNFFAWNKGIKSDCSNLFLGYYVCIGVK
ncbi:carbohydrate-binding module family 50 protein [Glonium stellatum]|uniref:Carbohydrate-binding module family 50 protein n=1 Tax=Glonium stellatum TaxID=574774 RepID=A0A8E2FA72_9PEZI|nr:carbohydrate-binding module family 50 protein [Glonium stellatum]